jgi:hypothetical protein
MWRGAYRQSERRVVSIEKPVSQIEEQRLQGVAPSILYSGDPGDIVISKDPSGRNSQALERGVFQLKLRCRVRE